MWPGWRRRVFLCLFVSKLDRGKRSVGGQKRRWNDVIVCDLRSVMCTPTGVSKHRTVVLGEGGSMLQLRMRTRSWKLKSRARRMS